MNVLEKRTSCDAVPYMEQLSANLSWAGTLEKVGRFKGNLPEPHTAPFFLSSTIGRWVVSRQMGRKDVVPINMSRIVPPGQTEQDDFLVIILTSFNNKKKTD